MKDIHQLKVGVLGGGQLGRMLIQSAINFNIDLKILDPDPHAPCSHLVAEFVVGSLKDFDTVMAFGQDLDVLTIEIENVNTEALEALQKAGVRVYPQPAVIKLIQDKRTQKQFYRERGIPTSDFVLIDSVADIELHADFLPAFQKLGRDGYDGRGVQRLRSLADLPKALKGAGLLEKEVEVEKEISVIVSRNVSGEIGVFPTVEMVYHPEHNLVDFLVSPADIPGHIAEKARELAIQVAEELGIVGLLAVEMFWDQQGNVLVNEVAPRPHNSGHHTIEACITSQYEQHLRAILGWKPGSTRAHCEAAMVNLLGESGHEGEAVYEGIDELMAIEGVHVHLYGKKITKPFRKMGHVTVTGDTREELLERIEEVKKHCRVIT